MKLLSITLADIRRFTEPVRVDGLGAGVNVLTAPNESGKSTLFDALQALFFQPHRGRKQEVKRLQPHAGGAPTVSVEVELEGRRFRITKRWLSRPMAEVHDIDGGDRLVAKGDAAEEWIARQTRADDHGGPAGLLWVRQGETALDGDSKAEKTARAARRDLMSSVAGEVEAMTGGRRMERARARVREELDALVTTTGRAKAGGPLKAAEDDVATLEARETALATLSKELAGAIAERRGLKREAAELGDPEAQAEAEARAEAARARLEAARQHGERADRGRERAAAAEAAQTTARDRLERFRTARAALASAETGSHEAQTAEATARQAQQAAAAARTEAEAGERAAREALRTAEAAHAAAEAAEREHQAAIRRAALDKQLAKAQSAARAVAKYQAAARTGPDAQAIAALDAALQDFRVQQALREQAAPRVTLRYASPEAPRATLADGSTLPDNAPRALPDATRLTLPGIGALDIEPGAASGDTRAFERAQTAVTDALAATQAATPEAAHAAHAARRTADASLREARAALAAIAPEGIEALAGERAALGEAPKPREPQEPSNAASRAETEQALTEARARLAAAETVLDRAARQAEAAALAEARAIAAGEAAARRLHDALAALSGIDDPAAEEARLTEARAKADATAETARAEAARLAQDAPDLDAATAGLTRARSALDATRARLQEIDRRLAHLDTTIALRAGEGVDEDLAATREKLTEARARLARFTFERDMLTLLQAELDAARISAREHYFEPVTAELRPLLRVLWPGAELSFDDDTILPTELTRDGTPERLDDLSGGTREQIALLVRLAFARLLARAGRPAPVILDDALVYTDDDRIERMFDALHARAGDMQLLVLSCRQRAFRALGGTVLGFAPGRLPPEAGS
ncbi:MAG: chromosome segregation protein SMC [Rhodobacterales bacterium]|nr:MAG: chromosome segregation protein SMC [Rhodobacterales bacterium]